MKAPRAIETTYDGYRFRSRIEARWAVFFNALGVVYEYEKQGFDLDGLLYLPDFWLPDQKVWVEIKGAKATREEEEKCRRLAVITGAAVNLFWGRIPTGIIQGQNEASDSAHHFFADVGEDYSFAWCECPHCGFFGIEFNGRAERLQCGCSDRSGKTYAYDTPRLTAAYIAARSARFEHGEVPR